jgi:uracil phosphoribosyltransferase
MEQTHVSQKWPQVVLLEPSNNIRTLQTTIRNAESTRGDFIFAAHRLCRLVAETALDQFPVNPKTVVTPTNQNYEGVEFFKHICGVTLMRTGEVMERALRESCKSIHTGHVLIQHERAEGSKKQTQVYYAKLPADVNVRRVLLMDPVIDSGFTILAAIEVLLGYDVKEENITLLCLFCTPAGLDNITRSYPQIVIITSEIAPMSSPLHFANRYFGT